MTDEPKTQELIEAIENQLHGTIDRQTEPELRQFYSMLAYHLGWEVEGAGQESRGNRVRPLFFLLNCADAG